MRFHALLAVSVVMLAACGGASEPQTPTPPVAEAPAASQPTTTAAPEAPAKPAAPQVDPVIQAQLDALPAPYSEANYSKGRRLFRQCQTCHLVEVGAGNLIGPNLHGIFGSVSASKEGFNYSTALQGANITWTTAEVDEWLANPRTYLPGNRMSFAGFRRENDRRDVIAYMLIATAAEAGEASE